VIIQVVTLDNSDLKAMAPTQNSRGYNLPWAAYLRNSFVSIIMKVVVVFPLGKITSETGRAEQVLKA